MGAFHAYDIRGIYNVDFDKETAYKVGFFLPELLSADKVLVGREFRLMRYTNIFSRDLPMRELMCMI